MTKSFQCRLRLSVVGIVNVVKFGISCGHRNLVGHASRNGVRVTSFVDLCLAIHGETALSRDDDCPLFRMGMDWKGNLLFGSDEIDGACRSMVGVNLQSVYVIVADWNLCYDVCKTFLHVSPLFGAKDLLGHSADRADIVVRLGIQIAHVFIAADTADIDLLACRVDVLLVFVQ